MQWAVRNPRTGRNDYAFEVIDEDALDQRCQAMRAAQADWAAGGVAGRVEALQAWRASLTARRDDIVAALTVDTGRRAESELEFQILIDSVDRWSRQAESLLAEPDPRPAQIPFIHIAQDTAPYPLVGVISPWNFPLLLANIDAIPALLAGCAVIVKPSEVTPRFVAPLQQSVAAVPALDGVLRYLAGAGETGAALVDRVDLTCFTGSVATGRRVGEACAARFIPAFLELGGKDPAIVAHDADLDRAASALLWGSVVNGGASCLSIERIYVDRRVHDPFVALLAEKARRLRFNYPDLGSGQLGPVISVRQAAVIRAHLADARAKGARVVCGGAIEELGGGLYAQPTVLTHVDHAMAVMTDETFGPIMPVMAVEGAEEAVRLANDSSFGLSAAVFAGDVQAGRRIAERLHAGAVSINDAGLTAVVHEAEKHAFKLSGLGGSRMGPAAIRRFTRRKAYLVNDHHEPDPWWFP